MISSTVIHSLTLKNFRNFSDREISFGAEKNIIIGNNGQGKSNILEALSLPVNPMVESHPEYLLQRGESVFFLSYGLDAGNASFSYDSLGKKRKYILSGKSTTKEKLKNSYPHVVSFHPMVMNLMYLGPSERRNFIDTILDQAFPEYKKILSRYKSVLLNRNKVLKNISEKKSGENELDFWDNAFLVSLEQVYTYRNKIIIFFQAKVPELQEYFFGKIESISFVYESKTDLTSPRESIESYIGEHRNKEILLRKTLRGPHLDDFDIHIDRVPLTHFASRGEVKSIILGMKFLETKFLEYYSSKKDIIFIIDDLLSELDSEHQSILWKHIDGRQSVISCIQDTGILGQKIFI